MITWGTEHCSVHQLTANKRRHKHGKQDEIVIRPTTLRHGDAKKNVNKNIFNKSSRKKNLYLPPRDAGERHEEK